MTAKQRMTEARRQGEFAAERLVTELKLPGGRQIDVFGIIEEMEVWLFFQELRGILGVYLAGPPAGILINSGRSVGVQRLTAAHELGHHYLNHGGGIDDDISLRAAPGRRTGEARRLTFEAYLKEIAAQAFAMSFLAPAQLVRDMMSNLGIARDVTPRPEKVYELSLHLGISYEATAHRLVALREIGPSNLDQVLIEPAKAKLVIGHGHKPENSRADVWPISSRQTGALIHAHVGDELALSLDEIPSSGYRWKLELDLDGFAVRLDDFVSSDNKGEIPRAGSKGQRQITLRVLRPGENRVRLNCVQAWRPQDAANQFFIMVDAEELAGKERSLRPSARRAFVEAT